MERIDEVHKPINVASAINPCSLNISINVVYEAQRKETVSKGTCMLQCTSKIIYHKLSDAWNI